MADRQCSLCGQFYTDDEGHDYDICVSHCYDQLEQARIDVHKAIDRLNDAYAHVNEALRIQKQDWWRKVKGQK